MEALDAGAEDVEVSDDAVEIFTERTELAQVAGTLREAGILPGRFGTDSCSPIRRSRLILAPV